MATRTNRWTRAAVIAHLEVARCLEGATHLPAAARARAKLQLVRVVASVETGRLWADDAEQEFSAIMDSLTLPAFELATAA